MSLSLQVLLLMCACLGLATAQGEVCGEKQHVCALGEATCQDGECQCNTGFTHGDPYTNCMTDGQVGVSVKNDPVLTNTEDQDTHFPLPCKYLLTHVVLDMNDLTGAQVGVCEVKAYAYNANIDGKFVPFGVDVSAHLNFTDESRWSFTTRRYGLRLHGDMMVTHLGSLTFDEDLLYKDVDIRFSDPDTGVNVDINQDEDENIVKLQLDGCGFEMFFVPFDTALGIKQRRVPGVFVQIELENNPQWLSEEESMGLRPGLKWKDVESTGLTISQSIVNRGILAVNTIPQNQPADSGECAFSPEIMQACGEDVERRKTGFQNCFWMFRNEKFVNCVDKEISGTNLLYTFDECVSSFCEFGASCKTLAEYLKFIECSHVELPGIPELAALTDGDLCEN